MRTAPARLASAYVTTVRLTPTDNAVSFDTDALVVGVHTGPDGLLPAPGAEGLDQALGGRLAATLESVGAKGKPGEISKIPTFGALTAPCWSSSAWATSPVTAPRTVTTPRSCAAPRAPRSAP